MKQPVPSAQPEPGKRLVPPQRPESELEPKRKKAKEGAGVKPAEAAADGDVPGSGLSAATMAALEGRGATSLFSMQEEGRVSAADARWRELEGELSPDDEPGTPVLPPPGTPSDADAKKKKPPAPQDAAAERGSPTPRKPGTGKRKRGPKPKDPNAPKQEGKAADAPKRDGKAKGPSDPAELAPEEERVLLVRRRGEARAAARGVMVSRFGQVADLLTAVRRVFDFGEARSLRAVLGGKTLLNKAYIGEIGENSVVDVEPRPGTKGAPPAAGPVKNQKKTEHEVEESMLDRMFDAFAAPPSDDDDAGAAGSGEAGDGDDESDATSSGSDSSGSDSGSSSSACSDTPFDGRIRLAKRRARGTTDPEKVKHDYAVARQAAAWARAAGLDGRKEEKALRAAARAKRALEGARDPNLLRRPLSAFMIFCERNRAAVRDDLVRKGVAPRYLLSKSAIRLGHMWRCLDEGEAERMELDKEARELVRRYAELAQIRTGDEVTILGEDALRAAYRGRRGWTRKAAAHLTPAAGRCGTVADVQQDGVLRVQVGLEQFLVIRAGVTTAAIENGPGDADGAAIISFGGDEDFVPHKPVVDESVAAAFPVGSVVRVHGLSTKLGEKINWQQGRVRSHHGDRVYVSFRDDGGASLRAENLTLICKPDPRDGKWRQGEGGDGEDSGAEEDSDDDSGSGDDGGGWSFVQCSGCMKKPPRMVMVSKEDADKPVTCSAECARARDPAGDAGAGARGGGASDAADRRPGDGGPPPQPKKAKKRVRIMSPGAA